MSSERITDTPDEKHLLHSPIISLFTIIMTRTGAADSRIPPATVNDFESLSDAVGIQNDIATYPGVNHAFANPSGDRMPLMNQRMHGKRCCHFLKTVSIRKNPVSKFCIHAQVFLRTKIPSEIFSDSFKLSM